VVLMTADPLDQLLRLVAEGRISAAEAAPILSALDERSGPASRAGAAPPAGTADHPGAPGTRGAGDLGQDEGPAGPGFESSPAFERPPAGASALRLEVRENGRQVVNLRLPIAIGRLALDRVPGLSGEQVERVREALGSGMRGPILQVEDGDSGVRIVLE
jgi:hypothetical protein